jgi:hypothetical protein
MKWLATILCLLTFSVAAAEEPPYIPEVQDPEQRMVTLPTFIQCAPVAPDTMLEQGYNELGFLEGLGTMFISPSLQTINGELRMFVDPDDKSWTIMLEVGPDLHCMVMSGEGLGPMVQGTRL